MISILFKKKKKNQVVFGNDKPKLNTVNAKRHFKDGMNIPTNQRAVQNHTANQQSLAMDKYPKRVN